MAELFSFMIEILYSILSLACAALPVIGMWLVFEKAGEQGWKALIPFYNMYILFKIGDRKKYWWLYLIGCTVYCIAAMFVIAYIAWILFAIILAFGTIDAGWSKIQGVFPVVCIFGVAAVAGYIAMLVATIFGYSGICKKMNQGAGMVIGLLFMGPIFWMILGVNEEYKWQHKQIDVYQQLQDNDYQVN